MSAFNEGLMTGASLGRGIYGAQQNRRVGGMLSTGDYTGAASAAYGSGDIRTGQAIEQQLSDEERQTAEQRAEILQRSVTALRGVPAEQRPAALQQMAPVLGQIFDQEALQALSQADLSDQSLDAFATSLGAEVQRLQLFQTRDGDIIASDPRTGSSRVVYDGPDRQEAPPNGYRWTQDGGLEAIPGGPADPRVVSTTAASRRAPPRSGGGSGGSPAPRTAPAPRSGTGVLPPGFRVRR